MKKKLVQFGAGNIGRSFIGQVFARSGYEVVFIDIDSTLIGELNKRGEYRVVIKKNDRPDEIVSVQHVRGVDGKDAEAAAAEITDAEYIATSVGKNALPHIMPVLAEGLKRRYHEFPEEPVDIIIAENIRNGAALFRDLLKPLTGTEFPLDSYTGLVETSIGKMVPIMGKADREQDPLWVFAEAYNRLIVDSRGFRRKIPPVESIYAVENITAYVDRKSFIHNMGHAATAYFGFIENPAFRYIWEPLQVPRIFSRVRSCMREAAQALHAEYPEDLLLPALEDHIDDLLNRFANKSLGDTIFRVGRDLYRKLGKNDRLIGAMLLAEKHSLPYNDIAAAAAAAVRFRGTDEQGQLFPGDRQFSEKEFPEGIDHILSEVCGLSIRIPEEFHIFREIKDHFFGKFA